MIGPVKKMISGTGKYQFFPDKNFNAKKRTFYALYGVIINCVKQNCNFYFQKYDILVIFVDFHVKFFADFCYPDPGRQNDKDPTGSESTSLN